MTLTSLNDEWSVLVGNLGCVYIGSNKEEAREHYKNYVEGSKLGIGRFGNETVVLFHHHNIVEEYNPWS